MTGEVTPGRAMERYLAPGELVIDATRRHLVVVDSALAVWLLTTAAGLAVGSAGPRHPGLYLGQIGAALCLAGILFLGCRVWQWWMARYVFTNQRVLLIEGIVSRRVNGLPLRSVLDTTYSRSLGGRLRGYGDLELNLSGRPGMRKLTTLPRPDAIYQLVLALMSGDRVKQPISTSPGDGVAEAGVAGEETAPLPRLRLRQWPSSPAGRRVGPVPSGS